MSIGTITVDLLARTGSFETDMNRSAKLAEKRAKEIDAAVTKAGAAVGAAFAAAGVAAVAMAKSVVDGFDALNDVKDATGASIENISALEDVALRTGGSIEGVSSILVKFNDVLKNADGKNAASQALKDIGLNAADLRREDPAEALRKVAVAFSGFADDGGKARRMQELFGKSVKEAAPFLNDLAEKTELVGKVSTEQAANAEKFNKQIAELSKNALDAKRALIGDLLPAVNAVLRAMAGGGVMAGLDEFGERAFGWTSNAKRKEIQNLKDEIDSLARSVERVGMTPGEIVMTRPEDVAELARKRAELASKTKAYLNFTDKRYETQGGVDLPKVDDRPSLGSDATKQAKGGGAVKAPKESGYQKYLENLQKELDRTEELTRAAMVLADVNSGRLKLEKGESLEVLLQKAKQIDANKALNEENKRAIEFENQLREARARAAEGLEKEAASLLEGNNSMRQEISLIGKNAEQQAALEQARLDELIAAKQQDLARQQNVNSYTRETAALEEQIRLLTERRDLVGLKGTTQQLADDAKKTEELANSVGTSFSSAFEKAVVDGEKLSDVLKGLAKDIAALAIRQAITVPLSNSIGQALGGLFGGGGDVLGDFIKIKGFANGGSPPVGKVSIVGERGPELFVPNTAGKIIPNHALGGGVAPVSVVINNTVGDVATLSQLKEAQAGTERRIAGMIGRSRQYGGALA